MSEVLLDLTLYCSEFRAQPELDNLDLWWSGGHDISFQNKDTYNRNFEL